jgi:hypothetical protein
MKVYSYLKAPMTDWVQEQHNEGFEPKHLKHLGDVEDRVYFSYDPEFVTVPEQDEKYEVKFYDISDSEDKAHLDSIKDKLTLVRQDSLDLKSKLFAKMDLFDLLTGLATSDKYVIEQLAELKKEHEDYLKALGF